MKKQIFALALAVTVMAGCQQENFAPDAVRKEGSKTVLTASFDQTRSTVSEEGSFAWAEGDTIGVMTPAGAFAPFILTEGAGTFKGTFTSIDDNVTVEKVAIFPYSSAKSLSDKQLTVTLPSRTLYVEGSTNSPMVASVTEGVAGNLAFKHLAGLLAITYTHIPVNAASLYVSSTSNYVSGDFTVEDYTADGACIRSNALASGVSSSSARIQFPDTPFEGSVTFYVPVPVGEYGNLSVSLLDERGYSCGKDTEKTFSDVTIERCDMRTHSFDIIDWDIVYGRRQGSDGSDRLEFRGCQGKWHYMYYQHAEFTGHYNSDVTEVLNELVNNCKNKNTQLLEGNKTYRLGFVFPAKATFYVMMAEMEEDYTPTGRYIVRSCTPAEEEANSEGFEKWIGTWLATGKDGNGQDVTYTLEVSTYSKNEQYQVTGWGGTTTKYRADYDRNTGDMVFRNHILSYSASQTSSSDGITYKCKGGMFGVVGTSGQNTPLFTTLATCTMDESGTTATMSGYQYYKDAPFVTMNYYYWSYTTDRKSVV